MLDQTMEGTGNFQCPNCKSFKVISTDTPDGDKLCRCRVCNYAFSVTKGINVDAIASQLPPHLQLEVYLHLNRQMVMQGSIFEGCSDDFYRARQSGRCAVAIVMGT